MLEQIIMTMMMSWVECRDLVIVGALVAVRVLMATVMLVFVSIMMAKVFATRMVTMATNMQMDNENDDLHDTMAMSIGTKMGIRIMMLTMIVDTTVVMMVLILMCTTTSRHRQQSDVRAVPMFSLLL